MLHSPHCVSGDSTSPLPHPQEPSAVAFAYSAHLACVVIIGGVTTTVRHQPLNVCGTPLFCRFCFLLPQEDSFCIHGCFGYQLRTFLPAYASPAQRLRHGDFCLALSVSLWLQISCVEEGVEIPGTCAAGSEPAFTTTTDAEEIMTLLWARLKVRPGLLLSATATAPAPAGGSRSRLGATTARGRCSGPFRDGAEVGCSSPSRP